MTKWPIAAKAEESLLSNIRSDKLFKTIPPSGLIIAAVLFGAALLGTRPSPIWPILLLGALGEVILIKHPRLGLWALPPVALLAPIEIGTGTEVALNPTILLIPALLGLWFLDMVRRRQIQLPPSLTEKPLTFFLLAGLLSLLVGRVMWDPGVPQSGKFVVVQLAQWAIFAFAAGIFWLTGSLISQKSSLERLTFYFLILAGLTAILFLLLGGVTLVHRRMVTVALIRAPFWLVLGVLAAGQLLFNSTLALKWRAYLLLILAAVIHYTFFLEREVISNWLGVLAAGATLIWLRWPRWRWPVIIMLLILVSTGLLTSTMYHFAGGDAEWDESGGSRLALIGRVVSVTMRNPITGLGPAAYRPYAAATPLQYGRAFWIAPQINSHNNYVDLFSHVGLLGLGFFGWFAVKLTRLGFQLRRHFTSGFAAGYVNSMIALWAGALVLMMFADWILPFVYNIGFPGFQASVLVWLFLGGLVSLEQIAQKEAAV